MRVCPVGYGLPPVARACSTARFCTFFLRVCWWNLSSLVFQHSFMLSVRFCTKLRLDTPSNKVSSQGPSPAA